MPDNFEQAMLRGFAPIIGPQAQVLILGSMPSVASLQQQQYYAHPRNAFWPIMGTLLGAGPELPYRQRKKVLIQQRVAVWDVLKCCQRAGSLDQNIDMQSIETNDFANLFMQYSGVQRVCFNGKAAEKLYRKHVLPQLKPQCCCIKYQRLPSTSPAHAALNLQQKTLAWGEIKKGYDTVCEN